MNDWLADLDRALRHSNTVVLVEGASDRAALEALAVRANLSLAGVAIVPIGGAGGIGPALGRAHAAGVRVMGLCDAGAAPAYRRALAGTGLEPPPDGHSLEDQGFFVCNEDLEDELIRAVGAATIEEVLAAEGDLRAFRSFQGQPAWNGRNVAQQMRRWLGAGSGRKLRYASLLVGALDPSAVPLPLRRLLDQL